MTVEVLRVERLRFHSSHSFEDVLAGLRQGIGRPNMHAVGDALLHADSLAGFEAIVHDSVGSADLMEFLRIDLGVALRIDPDIEPYRIMRIIAGNPLIMKELTRHVPDAGSYAPVTILVYEHSAGVHVCYDTMVSYMASYGSPEATRVAAALDAKVIALLNSL